MNRATGQDRDVAVVGLGAAGLSAALCARGAAGETARVTAREAIPT